VYGTRVYSTEVGPKGSALERFSAIKKKKKGKKKIGMEENMRVFVRMLQKTAAHLAIWCALELTYLLIFEAIQLWKSWSCW
jgi:hypothetical protein